MKKLCLLFSVVLILLLISCDQDTTQLAKDEFSKYYNEKNEVVLNIEDKIYFENYTLDLNDILKNNEYNNGLIMKQNRMFFSTSIENSMFNFTLNIYESNLDGTDIKLLFSREGFKTHPWAYAIDDVFYIEHFTNTVFDNDSKLIDKYTISTGIYENISSGKDSDLSNYYLNEEQSRYSIEVIENISTQEHGKYIVTDSKTGIIKTIDDDYLNNTIYIESMKKFNYSPKRVDISNGHILLTYGIGAGNGWNFAHLVFEYNFDSNTLEYKMLVFPYDSIPISIIYIG